MEQATRNKLRSVVTQCRELLEESIAQQLEGQFGIRADKKDAVLIEDEARMSHLTAVDQRYRRDLLNHLDHIKARGFKAQDALDQLIREIAFTHLNRLCAYKMMEARNVYVGGQKFREAVRRGINSNGFKFYLADHPDDERFFNTGQQELAYRHFLDWLGSLLSDEIGALFSPNDPANRLYPRQKTLDELLDLLNGTDIRPEDKELREAWPKLWEQDEAIGWVYQYFTPKELREESRDGGKPPGNSYELAFRNQFYTPRYVVQFLTDNTLGRIWWEMKKGCTKLKDQCRYLVRRPNEVLLDDGERMPENAKAPPELAQGELLKQSVYIPHRPKKDPRELKVLDPACGSGHFLVYCFDVLETIYEEAYADPDLGPVLQQDYKTIDALRRDLPRLILAHNLYGVDIDFRATQIAALALWLRCQRSFQLLGHKKDRPRITRSNLVCAEPMPGEEQMLGDFVEQLQPKFLGQLVEVVFDAMKLAGEAGCLLKIEEDIQRSVTLARRQWVEETERATDTKGQPLLFSRAEMARVSGKMQRELFDLSQISDDQFFEQAEARVVESVRDYAEHAGNEQVLQQRLFADDTVRGFAFLDVCRLSYDVILMNPPFGSSTPRFAETLAQKCPNGCQNLAAAFVEWANTRLVSNGYVGQVSDKVIYVKSTYTDYREKVALSSFLVGPYAELGWGVLDANVEVVAAVLSRTECSPPTQAYFDVSVSADKNASLLTAIAALEEGKRDSSCLYLCLPRLFESMPNSSLAYRTPPAIQRLFRDLPQLSQRDVSALQGHNLSMAQFARLWWEVPEGDLETRNVVRMYKGGDYSRFYQPSYEVAIWKGDGSHLRSHRGTRWSNEDFQERYGIGYGKRGEWLDAHVMPSGHLFTVEGMAIFPPDDGLLWGLLAYLNSPVCSLLLSFYSGQHKEAGYLRKLPMPDPHDLKAGDFAQLSKQIFSAKRQIDKANEASPVFLHPFVGGVQAFDFDNTADTFVEANAAIEDLNRRVDASTYNLVGIAKEDIESIQFMSTQPKDTASVAFDAADDVAARRFLAEACVSYAIGVTFGRWDIRKSIIGNDEDEEGDPFAALPNLPPGSLVNDRSCPSGTTPTDYPVRIDWDGILTDDQGAQDDIVAHLRSVLESLWNQRAEALERQICKILGVKNVRGYLQKTGKNGFWDDHIRRYSKRRKAPIYWLLQSSKKNYSIWLYYHRLDKDMLFKALLNYVEPKIQREDNRLSELRSHRSSAGDSAKGAKNLDRDIEKQEDLLSELREFEEKLRSVADLHLVPDLNDGVVLNIAPLHEFVPWKEAKKHWEQLLDGKHEWSSIGKQLREKGLVK